MNIPRRASRSDLSVAVGTAVTVLALCLGLLSPGAARADYTTVWDSGPTTNRVDITLLGDGYTAAQLGTTYADHVDALVSHMFFAGQDPFPRYRNYFNVHRVDVASNQSGADIPHFLIFRDTALNGTYNYLGIAPRLLYINPALADAVIDSEITQSAAPFVPDIKLVPINDIYLGGAPFDYVTYSAANALGPELALRAIARTFAGLGSESTWTNDPYLGPEPLAPNLTLSPGGEKWAHWLGYNQPGIGVIGAYEGGASFETGIYRPSEDSKLRSLGMPFDAVSREQIILSIYDLVDPLDDWLPTGGVLGSDTELWVDPIDSDVIQVEWYVDNVLIPGASGETFTLDDWGFGPGTYEVTARAFDDTEWVLIDLDKLSQSVTWSVHVIPEPATLGLFCWGAALLGIAIRRRRAQR